MGELNASCVAHRIDPSVPEPEQAPRRIYLLPGFDPGGTRTVLRLLRNELAKVEPRLKLLGQGHRDSISRWHIQAAPTPGIAPQPLAELAVLCWDDIVRKRWSRTPWELCWQGLWLYLHYLPRPSTLRTVRRLPKASFTFFWPLTYVLTIGLLAIAGVQLLVLLPLPSWLLAVLATAVVISLGACGVQEAERRRVSWLFRAIHFSCRLTHGEGGDLSERLDGFASQIEAGLRAHPHTPVSLVGHSTGSYLALKLAQRLVERGALNQSGVDFEVVTVGQNPALMASLTTQPRVRQDLHSLLDAEVPWTDLTCRDDWMSFAEVDLLEVLGRARGHRPRCWQVPLAKAAGLRSRTQVLNHQFVLHFQYFRHCGGQDSFSCLEWLVPQGRHD